MKAGAGCRQERVWETPMVMTFLEERVVTWRKAGLQVEATVTPTGKELGMSI